jgi:hypothetical protein
MSEPDPITLLIENAKINDRNSQIVARFLLRYYSDLNEVERRFPWDEKLSDQENFELADGAVPAKVKVHQRYWEPAADDYWKPSSHGNMPQYSLTNIESIKVKTDCRNAFLVEVKHAPAAARSDMTYLVEHRKVEGSKGRLFIVNAFA